MWLERASRRLTAIFLILGAIFFAPALTLGDLPFKDGLAEARSRFDLGQTKAGEANGVLLTDGGAAKLWDAQPGLVAKAIGALKPRIAGRSNVYAIAIAAGGAQQLFSREAHLALEVAAARFGASYRGGLLLSNGLPDILQTPLATTANINAVARGLVGRFDPAKDIALVYLAAHGSANATLATDLPNHKYLSPISSTLVADALVSAGIKRRIIIVSACYAGSWIPALASADSIVITAARKDRTSFGCDDRRRLTYFGEAFLEGPLANGGSLRDAFEEARKKVAGWEANGKLTPSEPQVHIGKNMQAFWTGRPVP
jgi:hypothetical protein